jgi:uncharacterized cofD-like protein
VFDEIGRRYNLKQKSLAKAYRAYNSHEVNANIRPFPDVISTLNTLKDAGIMRLLLTTGHHPRQQTKIKKLGLDDKFDDILINDIDRGAVMSECLRYLLDKHQLTPSEVMIIGDRPGEEIRHGNELGMTTTQILRGRFSRAKPRDQFEVPDYRISNIFQVPTILSLAGMGKTPEKLRIVALGGGTGLPIVLEGCKTYSENLTAVVAVTDSGRSSGKLRDELGMLAPGDARNCLVALSESGEKERQLNELFQYRFHNGSLDGMSVGNLIIAAMTDMEGSFEKGIKAVSNLLNIKGRVLPSTITDAHVCAELEDGTVVESEVNVRALDKPPIKRAFLKPEKPVALEETLNQIRNADIIVLGPGSLYTSIIANILVPDVRDALLKTKAHLFYVCNIMTQPGQTDGYAASDHLQALQQHLGERKIDCMFLNNAKPDPEIIQRYREEGAELITADESLKKGDIKYVETDLCEDIDGPRILWEKQDLLRHQPDKLGDAICRTYAELEMSRE